MTPLRKRLIRLAHEKPELRPHLLPLLRTAAVEHLTAREFWMKTYRRLEKLNPQLVVTFPGNQWTSLGAKGRDNDGARIVLGNLVFESQGWGTRRTPDGDQESYISLVFKGWV